MARAESPLRRLAHLVIAFVVAVSFASPIVWSAAPAQAATWVPQYVPVVQDVLAVDMVNASIGFLSGKAGAMWKTVDGGVSFSPVATPTGEDLFALDFVDANTGYVVGKNGVILKTTNGGATWVQQSHPAGTVQLTGVSFPVDATSGTAVGVGPTILTTSNGGTTWELRSWPTNQLEAVDFPVDNVTGYAVGLGGRVMKTTNGGVSWQGLNSPTVDDLYGVDFVSDGVTGYAVGRAGIIFKTTDGASSWAAQTSGVTEHLYDVMFTDASNGYAVGANGTLLNTTDGGATWAPQAHPGGNAKLTGVDFTSATSGTVVGEGPTILITTDGGASWELRSGVSNQLQAVDFPTDNVTGFAVGLGGRVMKTSNGGVSWGALTSPTGSDLLGVDFVDGTTGYAVGKSGVIFKTTDGAVSWAAQASGVTEDLNGVHFPVDATTGYVTGRDGTILKTTNGGATWVAQTSGVTEHLYLPNFPTDATTGFAVGESGTILKTTNGGSSWAAQTSGVTKHLQAVHFPTGATTGYATGQDGTVLKTTNGGSSWVVQTSGVTDDLFGVSFADDSVGYSVGQGGTILKTTNGGVTWGPQVSNTTENLFGVTFPVDGSTGFAVGRNAVTPYTTDGGTTWVVPSIATTQHLVAVNYSSPTTGYATGASGTIVKTTDGGQSWTAQVSGVTKNLVGVSFATDALGYAVGQTGTILKTTDGGSSWGPQVSNTTEDLFGVTFPVDGSTGFAVGKNGVTPYTTDGGTTWVVPGAATTENLVDVDYPSALIGYATGLNGTVIKTTDGGITWVALPSGTTDDLNGVSFADNNVGYAVGQSGTIIKTTNGGAAWAPQVSGTTEDLFDVDFADALNGVAVGKAKAAMQTTDGGSTWLALANGIPGDIAAIGVPVVGTFIMAGVGPTILRSDDGGATWTSALPFAFKLFGLDFPTAAVGYAVGEKGTAIKTTDGGDTWNLLGTPDITNFEDVDFVDATTGYVVGKSGTILKTTNGGSTFVSLPSGTTENLFAVSFPVDATTGYAAGKNGTIVKTIDGGASWATLPSGTLEDLFGIDFSDNSSGIAVGKNGVIVRTTDGGAGWSTRASGVLTDLLAAEYTSDPDIAYVVGKSGVVLKSTNGGSGWSSLVSGTTEDLEGVSFPVDAVTGFVAGNKGVVMMTTDGSSWSPSDTPTSARLHAITFTSNTVGAAIGDGPTIITTVDPTDEWLDQTPSAGNVLAVDFPTGITTGYTVGQKGTLLKTTNGVNWQALSRPTTEDLFGLGFADDSIGFAVGNDGLIIKTTNGGLGWSTLTSGTLEDLRDVVFPADALTGFSSGKKGIILKTTNGGSGWSTLTTPTTKDLFALTFPVDATTGFAVGQTGTILKTINGGSSWAAQTTPTTEDLFAVSFPYDTTLGFAVGKGGVILKTTNGGSSWVLQTTPVTDDLFGVDFVTGDIGHAVGKNGVILHTDDGGAGWSIDASGITKTLWDVTFPINADDGWAVGDGPNILKGFDPLPPNSAPTDIALAPSDIDENVSVGTTVGTLTTTDPDPADSHTYALVAGAGDTDNGLFTIVGDELRTAAALDFEALGGSLSIRVETTDSGLGNLTYEKALSITLNDANENPTDISLAPSTVTENVPVGTPVGTLTTSDPDPGDGHTYLLVSGTGDTNNGLFTIVGDEVRTAAALDYDTLGSPLSIRVETTDDGSGNLTYEKALSITLNNVNENPTDIALAPSDVDENVPVATPVGTLSTTDPDTGDSHTYLLVAGTGDTHNGLFTIVGDELRTNAALNFETLGGSLSVRVETTDDGTGNLTYEKALSVTLNDVNENPTDIALAPSDVDENVPPGTTVGTLSTSDPDPGDGHTYLLVAGAGDTDNGLFTIVGDEIRTAVAVNFEALGGSLSVRVETTDDGTGNLTFEKALAITLNDLNEDPTDIALSSSDVNENVPLGTVVGILTTSDPDPGDGHTYLLVVGTGDTHNGLFTIVGDELRTNAALNYESLGGSLTVRVETTDDGAGNLTYEEALSITLNDVNDAPTDIDLDSTDIAENQSVGTTVGTFSSTDVDSAAFTYTLVAGAGDADNARFSIWGAGSDELLTAEVFDFETQGPFSIRIQTDDGAGGTYQEIFVITVTDQNDPPTDIDLDSTSIAENQSTGTTVGTFSSSDVDSVAFTYTLVAGVGSTDNARFTIGGAGSDELLTAEVFDFETQGPFSIRVQTDDGAGGTYQEIFVITVTDQNDPPTDIDLDSTSIAENQSTGTTVGTFSSSDVDSVAFTYTLVAGVGDTDNARFTIGGAGSDELLTAEVFDFETQGPFSIRVQTDDGAGGTYQEIFVITVTDQNDPPTDIDLDSTSIAENQSTGTTVGTFSSSDVDSATFTYTLVAGTGDADNASFTISGADLDSGAIFDFETKSSYSIRVQTDDGAGGTYQEVFVITVTDQNDAPTDISITSTTVPENQPVGTTVGTLSSVDVDSATFTYTLVAGTGDADNASFTISGADLDSGAIFDFETKSSYSIRVQTDDGAGGTYQEVFVITVTDQNDAPVASFIADKTQPEGTLISHSATAVDLDLPPDTLIWTKLAGPGIITAGGSYSWLTNETHGPGTFTVDLQVSDGLATDTASFDITVTESNSDPVADPIPDEFPDEGDTVSLTATAVDVDIPANPLTWTLTGGPGAVTAGGAYSWTTTEADGPGTYTVTLQVFDGTSTDSVSFDVTVAELNTPPTANAIADQFPDEGDTVSLTATATDIDLPANILTWTLTGGPGAVTAGGAYSWTTTEADGPGTYTVTLQVSDGLAADIVSFDVTVAETTVGPSAGSIAAQFVNEGGTVSLVATATDADLPADTLTWTHIGGPGAVTATGTYSWTTNEADGPDTYTVTLRVTDGTTDDTVSFDITVAEVNAAPLVAPIDDQDIAAGDTVSLVATATDSDVPADSLTWTQSDGPGAVAFGGSYVWETTEDTIPGTYSVRLFVFDGSVSVPVTFDIIVSAPEPPPVENTPPVAADDVLTVEPGLIGIVEALANDSDPDGDVLTIIAVGRPSVGTLEVTGSGTVTFTAPADFEGEITVDYVISDGNGGSATATITIVADPTNHPPDSFADVIIAQDYRVLIIPVLDNDIDPDGDTIRVLSAGVASAGRVELNDDGTISYYPESGWTGTESFSYTISDELGSTDTALVIITITAAARDAATVLSNELGTQVLPFENPAANVDLGEFNPSLGQGITLMADAFFQSVGAMSLPLIFLAIAMLMVFAFGGFSEVPLLIAAHRSKMWSSVLYGREDLMRVYAEPSDLSPPIYSYEPTARGVKSVDRVKTIEGRRWVQVESPKGVGWTDASHLAETVAFNDFQTDHRPAELVRKLTQVLDEGGDLTSLVGERGLAVALTGSTHVIPRARVAGLRTAGTADPDAPPEESRFEELVAQPLRSALLDNASLSPQTKHSQSALIATEMWNFPYLAIHSPGHSSWLIHFEYVHGRPAIVGLAIDE